MSNRWAEQADKNASKLEREIGGLSHGHWDMFKRDYRGFWAHAKKISQLFKELKPLKKEDREGLWSKFSLTCDETKQRQKSENKDRVWKSERLRDDILSEITSAEVITLFGFDPPDVEEMKRLSQILKRAGRMLSDNKKEMIGDHKQECFSRIQEVQRSHDAWWEDLKRHKDRKHEDFQSRVKANLEKNHERHTR